jgi:aspartate kinase
MATSPQPAGAITGIAGKKGYSAIQVEKERSNSEVGYCRRILSCLEENGVPFEHLATGIGSVSLVAPTELLQQHRQQLLDDIYAAVHPDTLQIVDGLAMIAVVGRGMAGRPGVAGQVCAAVGQAGVNVRMLDQGSKELNIVVGVEEQDFETAMRAIYGAFFQN